MTPFSEAARQLVFSMKYEEDVFDEGPPKNGRLRFAGRFLSFRHHGLGMLQAELSDTLRIHIWHPRLVSEGMKWPRCAHDHRFNITSAVIIGSVRDVPVTVEHHPKVWHEHLESVNVYEIQHAKEQDRMVTGGCSTATRAKLLFEGYASRSGSIEYQAGSEYFLAARRFHTTEVDALAVTVVHRANFDDKLARVLSSPDKDVTAISGIVRDDSPEHAELVLGVLREAERAIAELRRV